MLYFAKRPDADPAITSWSMGRQQRTFTRVGRLTTKREQAERLARKLRGRLYAYDGREQLVADFAA